MYVNWHKTCLGQKKKKFARVTEKEASECFLTIMKLVELIFAIPISIVPFEHKFSSMNSISDHLQIDALDEFMIINCNYQFPENAMKFSDSKIRYTTYKRGFHFKLLTANRICFI